MLKTTVLLYSLAILPMSTTVKGAIDFNNLTVLSIHRAFIGYEGQTN